MSVTANDGTHHVVTNHQGQQLSRVPRIPLETTDAIEKLSTVLRLLATFQSIRSLSDYQQHSPIPDEWFSVRLSNKNKPFENASSGRLELFHGDSLRYTVSNRTDNHTAHVHMLSLNASWTVGTLLWHVHLPPRQHRTGDFTLVVPRKVNNDDPTEAEDTIVVIFCVGEQSSERLLSSSEWLGSVYIPPVLLVPGVEANDLPVWPFFVPPPNWCVKRFTIRTVQRPQSPDSGGDA